MADRQVKATLSVQMQGYIDGMAKVSKATRDTGTEAEKLKRELADTKDAFDKLGRASLAAGALLAVGVGLAVSKFAEFDQAMSNVQAATHESTENMELLSKAAIEAGASTVYSATEAAGAIEELAKAGISTTDILGGGLAGALDLAAAGGIEVAEAAAIAATTMQQFGLKGDQAAHVADLLAAGAGKAMGDVTDMSMALKQSGLVANQFGISVEETTGALAAFASQGLLGSDAGTSFKTMLLQLAKPSAQAAEKMEELGINVYDTAGRFVGLTGLALELEEGLAGLTDQQKQSALATIFGTDAIRAATVLYDEGAAGIAEWTAQVNDAGYAAETAATRLDNLKGDLEALSGAVDSAFISMGAAADGPLRFFVQALTDLVNKFNEMPAAGQQAVFWLGAIGAAGATAMGSYLLLVPKLAEFNTALDVLGPNAQRANRAVQSLARVGGVAAALGVAALGVDFLSQEIAKKLLPSAEEVDNKFRSARTGIQLFQAALNAEGIQNTQQAGDLLKNLSKQLDAVADSTFWNQSSISGTAVSVIKSIAETAKNDLPEAQAQFRQLAEDGELTDRQLRTLIKHVPELQNALLGYADTSKGAASSQDLLNIIMGESEEATTANENALRALAGQAEATGEEVDGLADQIRNFGAATLDVRDANRQFEQAVDDLTASITENGNTLERATEEGRENEAALDDLAKSALEYAAATYDQTGSQEEANRVLAEGRARLIEMLNQFGITGPAAEAYADDLGLIPANISTYVSLNTSDAEASMRRLITLFDGSKITVPVRGSADWNGPGFAGGGAIGGGGAKGVDSVPIMAAPGEHMLTAADVDAMGGQHAVYAWRESLHGGGGAPVAQSGSAAVLNVYPQPGMDEEQIGRAAAHTLEFSMRGGR